MVLLLIHLIVMLKFLIVKKVNMIYKKSFVI